MSLTSHKRALDDVASDLPFAVTDYEAANELYRCWRLNQSPDDGDVLLKWIFCYSRRYFITKWMLQPDLPIAEMEEPLNAAFHRCRRHLNSVRGHDTFASYVSVICRNAFLNFCRRRARHQDVGLESVQPSALSEPPEELLEADDRALLMATLHAAIGRLPDWLRLPAQLRLIEGLDYPEIAERTGLSRATLRAYVSKALAKIRADPAVAPLLREWQD